MVGKLNLCMYSTASAGRTKYEVDDGCSHMILVCKYRSKFDTHGQ